MADTSPVRGPGDSDACPLLAVDERCAPEGAALDCLRAHGAVVLTGRLSDAGLAAADDAFAPLLAAATAAWDADADALKLTGAWGVTRLPRVSAGKKNVHFSSGSPLHAALVALAEEGGFARLLSQYTSGRCTLTETGLSLTRGGGEGMEWHADGGEGEATVLLSLSNQPSERGSLGLVPGSHMHYQPGAEGGVERARELAGNKVAWQAYEAGAPVLIDARTLHCAASNRTAEMRCVAWFIFNQET